MTFSILYSPAHIGILPGYWARRARDLIVQVAINTARDLLVSFICLWYVDLMCNYWVDSQRPFIQVFRMEHIDNYIGFSEAEN
jgi:hypothetical protein